MDKGEIFLLKKGILFRKGKHNLPAHSLNLGKKLVPHPRLGRGS